MDWKDDEYLARLRRFQPRKPSLPYELVSSHPRRLRLRWASVAAVIFLGLLTIPIVRNVWKIDVYAVVETADGGLFRVSGGETLERGERIEAGEAVRTNGGVGSILTLADGSRIEIRAQSELSLQRVVDGVRIHLARGGVIVNAAKQSSGRHLYVHTKDLTVSVVGTVFLVNAEEEGSRIAVIEGEVRVQQGTTERKLRSGEQLATNPLMGPQPVRQEIEWSRQAEAHLAVLKQSTVPTAPQRPTEPAIEQQLTFEVASIRPSSPLPQGGGARGNNTSRLGCSAGEMQLDPRRFVVTNVNLYTLITMAYASPGRDCLFFSLTDSLAGGPGWVRSDQFDIQATIPEGTPGYTATQFRKGESPEVQKMLQELLAKRFKLVLGRETKEMSGFALVLGKTKDAAQLAELAAETIRRSPVVLFSRGAAPVGPVRTGGGRGMRVLDGRNASITELAARLAALTGRPVVDQTGLTGQFTFDLQYQQAPDTLPGNQGSGRPLNEASSSSLLMALESQLGLKLEPARNPVEVLVITHAEKPSEN